MANDNNIQPVADDSQIVLYQPDDSIRLEVKLDQDTVWLTQGLFPDNHIDIRKWRNESHDRWLIIDDSLYHCGHSLNANGGHKISAITLMGISPEVILSEVE